VRKILLLAALLFPAAAMAQTTPPPAADEKPAAQAAPAKPHAAAAKSKPVADTKPKSIAEKLQACLLIDDGTKGRLDCYDAVFAPKPNPKAPAAKRVADCRLTKEEDQRLACYNGFAESIPKFTH
jgi:hypothetical protein